jgi:hypothetical protein
MAKPTIVVRVAFASNPFDAVPAWTTITDDVIEFNIRRGRQNELDRMEAGTADVVVNNLSGNYWTQNTDSIYYPNVLPLKRINIRATYNAITYDLFTGYIESYEPRFVALHSEKTQMVLRCVDIIKSLSRLLLNSAGYAQELSGTRVTNVLASLGWLGTTDADVGIGTMIVQAAANLNAIDHLFQVQDSEAGILYVAGDGHIQFEDRHHRVKGTHIVSQATFGHLGAGDLPYHNIAISYDDQLIYNDTRITRSGGTEQTDSDAASQTTYGKRSLAKTNLLFTTDTEALSYAQYLKTRYKDPFMRVKSITIEPEGDEVGLYPKALGYDISTRITLKLTQAMINNEYFIESVSHRCSGNGPWQTTWELSRADMYQYWQLGVAGFSEIGQTTRLYF